MNDAQANVALDGDTRRCCNYSDCMNDYPCQIHNADLVIADLRKRLEALDKIMDFANRPDLDKALAEHDAALLAQCSKECTESLAAAGCVVQKLEADNAALREALRMALEFMPDIPSKAEARALLEEKP